MEPRQIRQQIDACRPSTDDLSLPELAELADELQCNRQLRETFARAQAVDTRIAHVMDDVSLPAGLEQRLLDSLLDDGADSEPGATRSRHALREEAHSIADPEAKPRTEPVECSPAAAAWSKSDLLYGQDLTGISRPSRRCWLVTLASCAAVAIAAAAFWQFRAHGQPLSVAGLLADAGHWHAHLSRSASWSALPPGQSLKDYPPSTALRTAPHHWSDISAWAGRPAVAYDLSDDQGHRATLFVIPAHTRIADAMPPRTPGSNTGGQVIGIWQADGQVYVLVVDGELQRYRFLIDVSGPPLA